MINRSSRFIDVAGVRIAVWIDLLVLGVLTAFLTWYCVTYTLGPQYFAYLWLPNGFAVGTLLSVPQRLWPKYLGVALFGLAAGRVQLLEDFAQLPLQAAIPVLNLAEIFVIAKVLAPQVRETDRNNDLAVIAFVIALIAVPTTVSVAASLVLEMNVPTANFGAAGKAWFYAHTLGLLLAAPLVMVARKLDVTTITRKRALRLVASLVLVALALGIAVSSGNIYACLIVPVSIVAAAAFAGILGAVLSNLLAAAALIGSTQYRLGPFEEIGDIMTETGFVQLFLIGCIVASLGLALYLAFQRRKMLVLQIAAQDSEGMLRTEPLTSLPNSLALEIALAEMQSRTDIAGLPVSVAVFNMIGYDALRHTQGRDAAHTLVRTAAEAMKAVCRDIDFLAHVSDHELVAVMPLTDRTHAMDVASHYHDEAARAIKSHFGVDFRISVFVDTTIVTDGTDLARLVFGSQKIRT